MNNSAPNTPPLDSRSHMHIGLLTLILGFGGFALWAALAPLDEGVPLSGVVAVESNRKTVQHLTGGIIKSINTREGDRVSAGATLLTLDTSAQSAEASVIGNQMAGLAAQAEGMRQSLPQLQSQATSLRNELAQLEPLLREELYPRNSYAEKQRQLAQLTTQLISAQTEHQQIQARMAEMRNRLALLNTEMARANITAPVSGNVIGLNVHTIGGIIAPGAHILDVLPENDKLIIEGQIPPHLIEVMHADLPARLRFSALNPRTTPVIEGVVSRVSPDRIVDSEGNSYYSYRVKVSAEQLLLLGTARLQPGMPVEVIVLTGERTFMNYLLKPLSDSFAMALKER
ncbi:MAG: HlyD family efflux transporter periplasmic adaptor subunit [Pseudomonadota bacterium]